MVKIEYVKTDKGVDLYRVEGVEGLYDYETAKRVADEINKKNRRIR